MNKPLTYIVGLFSAVCVALILYVFAEDVFAIPREAIIVNSLGTAGALCLVCMAGALRERK